MRFFLYVLTAVFMGIGGYALVKYLPITIVEAAQHATAVEQASVETAKTLKVAINLTFNFPLNAQGCPC